MCWWFPETLAAYKGGDAQNISLRKHMNKLKWKNDSDQFQKWKTGMTGFPLVDAGIRQLLATGYMHNRVRMVVSQFLVCDLLIDWRKGEQFFAQHLTDYYPTANNGGWSFTSNQYTRVFNPWIQSYRFDKDCMYIKRWVPELTNIEPSKIHKLYNYPGTIQHYPRPIIDHKKAYDVYVKQAKEIYNKSRIK